MAYCMSLAEIVVVQRAETARVQEARIVASGK